MSAVRPSLMDDDSEGYSGEDSIREISIASRVRQSREMRKTYLSPKEIKFEPGQVRKTTIEYTIENQGLDTPMRKVSRFSSNRLTPVQSRLRQCKALIRPLHSRYYPFCIAFYILIAALGSAYFFGATPTVVTENVLDPVVISVGDAVNGMKEKMGDAYMGVRDSMGDVYSGVKERIKDVVEEYKKIDEGGRNVTIEEKRAEEKERNRKIDEMITKEISKISYDMNIMKQTQEIYIEWSDQMNAKFKKLEAKIDSDTNSINKRLDSFETALHHLKMDLEEKMNSMVDKNESPSSQSLTSFVSIEEFRVNLENTKKEMDELRRMVPREDTEEYLNLASYTSGASIIDSATSSSLYSSVLNMFSPDRTPIFVLTERHLFPGDCMPLPSTGGEVGINLSTLGHISHIEYYHLYWSEAAGIPQSAPKRIQIMGCADDFATVNCETIAECEYNEEMKSAVAKSIRIKILSNHGAEHTCLYLMRVIGKAV
ncbi:hypothetical protein PRIPAC_92355 [Pristionchus pacificus]|uniref:SUN domain-containing protein n=1 Tax=Pristionchus pacificus TaxID=54126 RepID=A0A2A6B455_PRIPA|nr:hypothetical protein PRIPAC_92355 [Pristionchus pacificus]|eukprot:PDM60660.1 hypothetical protein PRIPAC_53929 [Pristionchus pacificus]